MLWFRNQSRNCWWFGGKAVALVYYLHGAAPRVALGPVRMMKTLTRSETFPSRLSCMVGLLSELLGIPSMQREARSRPKAAPLLGQSRKALGFWTVPDVPSCSGAV